MRDAENIGKSRNMILPSSQQLPVTQKVHINQLIKILTSSPRLAYWGKYGKRGIYMYPGPPT